MSVCAVVGGQFGSEGKGLIVGHIAKDYNHHVRVGAANAGHTLYTDLAWKQSCGDRIPMWEKHVMQQVPCAAYANPEAELYIGPGALISPDIFADELDTLGEWRGARGLEPKVVYVDARAHVITEAHVLLEQASDLAERIGSTSTIAREGIGAAQAARVMRELGCVTAERFFMENRWPGVELADVPARLAKADSVLLEGTQGASLSLTTGHFPYVTSRNTTAAGLCADVGMPPTALDRVILVARTYPIRVAGPSGPFWSDSVETSWEAIGIDPESERTTVTKKVRRVATFSLDQVEEAVTLNGPTEIALTFADYLSPRLAGATTADEMDSDADSELLGLIEAIQTMGTDVAMLGTGPHSVIDPFCW